MTQNMSTEQESNRTTHTPGPWRIGNDRLMIYGADDHLIARVYHNKQFTPARPGDAYLIASAPDMKDALEFVLANSGDPVMENVARAAIAKAEGK